MALPNLGAHPDGAIDMPATGLWREIISNVRDRLLQWSNENVVEVDCTVGGTIVLSTTQRYAAQLVRLTGTPGAGFTIEMADGNKQMEFENVSGQTATIESATGATTPPTIATGTSKILHLRGTDFTVMGTVGLQAGALLRSGAVNPTGNINFADFLIARAEMRDVAVTVTSPSSSAGTLVLDLENGNAFDVTLTEDVTTLTLDNPPATGRVGTITLIVRQDGTGGHDITWPSSVKWNLDVTSRLQLEGSEDVLLLEDGSGGILLEGILDSVQFTDANSVSVYTLKTFDAGTTWYAIIAGSNMK